MLRVSSLVLQCAVLALLALTAPARAAGIDEPGSIILSVDRLFGLSKTEATTQRPNAGLRVSETKDIHTDFAFLGGSHTHANDAAAIFNTPRIALDVTLAHGLTLGGAFT